MKYIENSQIQFRLFFPFKDRICSSQVHENRNGNPSIKRKYWCTLSGTHCLLQYTEHKIQNIKIRHNVLRAWADLAVSLMSYQQILRYLYVVFVLIIYLFSLFITLMFFHKKNIYYLNYYLFNFVIRAICMITSNIFKFN